MIYITYSPAIAYARTEISRYYCQKIISLPTAIVFLIITLKCNFWLCDLKQDISLCFGFLICKMDLRRACSRNVTTGK